MGEPGSLAAAPNRVHQGIRARLNGSARRRDLAWQDLATRLLPLLFFALLGVGLYQQALHPDFPPHHLASLSPKDEMAFSGRLYRPARVGLEGVRLYVAVEARQDKDGWGPATGNLLVSAPPLTAPPVGTLLFVRGKLREPQALLNPGAVDRPRQLAAEGIYRQMYLKDADHVVFLAADQAPSLAESLRGGIRTLLRNMPPDVEAIYLSMLLGDQGRVTPEMRKNLSRTGTSHLLVINGMHLGAVAAVTYFLVFWILRLFPWLLLRVNAVKIATLSAALPVVGYAHLAGGSPSTQRAEVMVLAGLLLMFLGRFRDVWSVLSLAALWILAWSPLLLFSVSFQLSFAAVIGIVYLVPRLADLASRGANFWGAVLPKPGQETGGNNLLICLKLHLKRLGRHGWELLIVSLAASLATSPLVAHHFQVVSCFGFLVNVVAIPLVLMVALPLGELAILTQGFGLIWLAKLFLYIGGMPLAWGYGLITRVAALPGSGVAVPTTTWLQVALMYALIFLVLPVRRSTRTWVGAGVCAVFLAATVAWPGWQMSERSEITILDSHTGLDGVLAAPGGRRLAVTAAWDVWPGWEGGGFGPLAGYLHWRQFPRLNAILALNLNARNTQEVMALAQQFEVDGVWWRGPRPGEKVMDLMNCLGDRGRPALALDKMHPPKSLGDMQLTYLTWEQGRGAALQVTCRGREILILPPLKKMVLADLPWPQENPLDVLIAAGDASPAVVARLKPENLILYGSREPGAGLSGSTRPPCLTKNGAVTCTFTDQGARLSQWRP